jgi:serine/threonine protein kinase
MKYIHGLSILHRDLKCDNILVGKENIAKIADLGIIISKHK